MAKKQLAILYDMSRTTLSKLLNKTFFEQLSALGYSKDQRIISPCVIRKFKELYGKPLKEDEL